ncbi:MAG: FAD-dependent oxidoreductase [Limnochordales bacterium]
MARSIIIGGGVIGLLSAYELRRRGRDVIVIDKGNFGQGASAGNAGWITPSLSAPVPAPGLVAQSIKWMLRPDSPLYVKPSVVPGMLGWLLEFWRHCNVEKYEQGRSALGMLNRLSLRDFDRLAEQGLDFEMHSAGLLYVFRTEEALRAYLDDLAHWEEFGASEPKRLTPDEARELEPALRPEIIGGLLVESERHVRPEKLLSAAEQWLRANGADMRAHTEVADLVIQDGRVTGVRVKGGDVIEGDEVLLATGAEAASLAARAGFELPMQAGKGYSLTIRNPKLKLGRSMYLVEGRVALAPYDGALRLAGTMELSGINTNLYEERIAGIRKSADLYLTDWSDGDEIIPWVGMRPMLPDGLPAIGRAPTIPNFYIASGHAMLGVTLGPTTAALIADLMTKGQTEIDLTPFDPARFDRRLAAARR